MAKLTPAIIAVTVTAAAGAAAFALLRTHAAPAMAKEECYGIAKAGENDCASANGSHTCGGLAKVDFSGQEYKNVDKGTCLQLGGKLEAFDNSSEVKPKAE